MENEEKCESCYSCSNYCQNGSWYNYKTTRQIIILAIVLGSIGLGVLSLLRDRIVNQNHYQVSFTADAKVFAKPDIAQISLAVKTDRTKDSVAAVKNNTDKMNAVIAKIKELGVEEKDIKTTAYNLRPEYDYPANTGRSVLAGYSVYQEVTAKVRNLNNIGKIIESATAAGANQVGNVSFTIDDLTELKAQARAEAISKAKEQAKNTASLAGIKLGKIVNIWENTNPIPYDSGIYQEKAMSYGIGGGESAPEIQTGENQVSVEVTLSFEVK